MELNTAAASISVFTATGLSFCIYFADKNKQKIRSYFSYFLIFLALLLSFYVIVSEKLNNGKKDNTSSDTTEFPLQSRGSG